ncbi:MAG: hypothetical protein ACRDRN_23015 [Sciscionella sp.]
MSDHQAADRSAFRAFVLSNHPDVGGDPAAFIAGLSRFRRAHRGVQEDESRYDAPVILVGTPHGLHRALRRLRQWRDQRRRPPRVE